MMTPLSANAALDDYHLLPDSPCIDKGTADALELLSIDFEGDERIIGIAPDIGAVEFDPSVPPITTSTSSTTTTTMLTISTTTSTSPQPCTSESLSGEHSEVAELLRYLR